MSEGYLWMNREMGIFTIRTVVRKAEMETYERGLYERFHLIATLHDCLMCEQLGWPAQIMLEIERCIPDIEAEHNGGGKLYLAKRCVQYDEEAEEIHLLYAMTNSAESAARYGVHRDPEAPLQ